MNKPNGDLNHEKVSGEVVQIPLEKIIPNRYQPRKTIEKESLQELIDSVSTHGVLQPIVVRRDPKRPDTYEIMMGERRFRSCEALKKATIPAIITEADDQRMMECALIENTHRKDLNPIERAQAYKLLSDTFNLTQEEVAKRVGADRTTVSHFIRLLGLPQEIQDDICRQPHLLGHAKAILAVPDSDRRMMIWRRVRNEDLSVRNVRIVVDAYLHPRGAGLGKSSGISAPQYRELHAGNDPVLRECAADLWKKLGIQADIRFLKIGDKLISGTITIPVQGEDDLKRIVQKMTDNPGK
jgi:ParB family chromosome partitioning protein